MVLVDRDERERAASALDTPLLVEASAGTGKTTTMVHRLIRLLTNAPPGEDRPPYLTEIAAITFTERAAQELKDRLRTELFRALETAARAMPPGSTATYLAQALTDLEQAPIGTIHGFCGRILRQYPIEAGIDVQFAVADERQADDLRTKAWHEWLTRELEREGAASVLRRALEVGFGTDSLRALGYALLTRRAWPIADLLVAEQDVPFRWDEELAAAMDLVDRIERKDPSLGVDRPHRPTIERMHGWLAECAGIADERAREHFILRNAPFEENGKTAAPLIERVGRLRAAISQRELRGIVRWLTRPADDLDGSGFLAEYARAKQALGVLDFDDLVVRARDLVRDSRSVRRELQAQYRFLVVDEFQDTDPVQAELIVHLAAEDAGTEDRPWTEATLVPGKLCVVGDPKQSIYRFRGADIETYSQVARLIGEKGACTLSTNFRSHRRIIAAVNDVFGRPGVFSAPDAPRDVLSFRPAYQPLQERPDAPADIDDAARVRWIVSGEPLAATLTEGRPREARLVAAAIRRIVADGWRVTDAETGELRPVRPGDIAVLYRKATHVELYERELESAGIPYYRIGGRGLYEREEIVRLVAVLAAIEQPSDALHVVAALRSPFFGASDADLAQAALVARSRFDYRAPPPADLPESVREAFACLRELHEMRQTMRPSEVVQALFSRTKVLAAYAQAPNGERAVANLLKVLDEARRLERDGPVPFRRLTERLRVLREGGDEGEAAFEDEAGSRVRLLTVHKAKGLEFPIVIVIDLAAGMTGGRTGPAEVLAIRSDPRRGPDVALRLRTGDGIDLATARWTRLQEADKDREAAEAVRLLYVAMTRARDYLLLPQVVVAQKGSWQETILGGPESETWEQWMPGPLPPASASEGRYAAVPCDRLSAERNALAAERERLREERRRRRVRYVRPSLHELDRGTLGEDAAPMGVVLAATDQEEARRLGTVVHAALELLDPGDDDGRIREIIGRFAIQCRLSDESAARARDLVRRGLDAAVVRRARAARYAWREVPVMLCEEKDGEEVVTRGTCDLVFEEDGALVLVDYKTDRVGPRTIAELVGEYRSQVAAYVRALEVATGCAVSEAWLCFLAAGDRAAEVRVNLPR